jgi:TIR domain-containing protein
VATLFVSYRRRDTAQIVGRVCDRLKAYYGAENIFLDIDDLPYGVDFRNQVRERLRHCDVVIAVIGSSWRGVDGDKSRLDDKDDPVRVEIECALGAGVAIVPVLVDGAPMPAASQVPESVQPLIYLNAVSLSSGVDYHQNVDRLIAALNFILGPKAPVVQRAVSFARITKTPLVWAVFIVLVLPFVAAALGIAPPWPPGVQFMTAALQAATIVAFLLIVPGLDRRSMNRYLLAAAATLAVCGSSFLIAQSAFVFRAPTTGERFVKGFVCSDDAKLVYKAKCPFLGQDEIQGTEFEAERLWTIESIALTRVAIDLLWLGAFAAISVLSAFGIVYVLHERSMRNDSLVA